MAKSLLKELNKPQQEAVTFDKGPLLILAGAGSGKTRALTYRVAYLINQKGIDPSRILLVTFTNKAAEEMKNRVKKLVGKKTSLPWAGTFHSFCAKLLRIEGKAIGVSEDFVIYDEKDSLEAIKQAMDKLKISTKLFKPKAIKATISMAKNELIGPLEYTQYARGQFQKVVAQVYREYQRLLKEYEALDFDDLLVEAVRLLKKEKRIRDKYANQFLYVLVDEYQDTNRAQYELTKALAGKWRNLAAVGDFSQSIYSFRGADYRNLDHLRTDYSDLKIINLEQNYRSSQNILDAAHQVIKKNTSHPVLKLWTKAKKGERIKLYEANDEKEEAGVVIERLQQDKLKQGKKFSYSDFAVLYRTNAQSRVIEEGLIRAGIPYLLVGGVRFYDRREIKDCLAYLKFIKNPRDAVSFQRLMKIGKRRLAKFETWLEKNREKIKSMSSLKLLDQVFKVTGYLDRFDDKNEQDLVRLENIKELKSVAAEFKKLGEFLEKVALVQQTDPTPERRKKADKEAVTLMTLHASKGLEFKTVFMLGMEEGLFPHSRSMLDKQELEEERRLCYVGMTRAKNNLWLVYTRRRLYFGVRSRNMISRFLTDISEELLEPLGINNLSQLIDDYDQVSTEGLDSDMISLDDY